MAFARRVASKITCENTVQKPVITVEVRIELILEIFLEGEGFTFYHYK